MTVINKKEFLEGLERLLTFMSDEDRGEALTLYEKMFDDADDESSLVRALESPTRQAIVIARAYDAKRRKLSRGADDTAETPAFVRAILRVYEEAVPLPAAPLPQAAPVYAPTPVYTPEPEPVYTPAPEPEPFYAPEPEEIEPLTITISYPEDWEEPEEEAPRRAVLEDQVTLFDEEDAPEEEPESLPPEPAEAPAEETAPEREAVPEEEAAEEEPLDSGARKDAVLRALLGETPRPEDVARSSIINDRLLSEDAEDEEEAQGRTNVPLLILFVLLAIPVTVCGVLLLLIPTLLSLVISTAAIVLGCGGLLAVFGGVGGILADMLIVFGCSVAALALGLLFLWLFIWFVGGPTVGLVRAVIRLGARWCCKEVAE